MRPGPPLLRWGPATRPPSPHAAAAGQAHHFRDASELLRLLLAAFRPLPQPLGYDRPSPTGAPPPQLPLHARASAWLGAAAAAPSRGLGHAGCPPARAACAHSTLTLTLTLTFALMHPTGDVLACLKVQAFLLALFAWVVPAFVMRRLELQASKRGSSVAGACAGLAGRPTRVCWPVTALPHAAACSAVASAAVLAPHKPLTAHTPARPRPPPQMLAQFAADEQRAAAQAAADDAQRSGAPSSSSSSDAGGGSPRAEHAPGSSRDGSSRPGLRRRLRQAWRSWEQQLLPAAEEVGPARAARPPADAANAGWSQWGLPLLLAGMLWHTIDTLLS